MRAQRVAEQMKKVVAGIIEKELKDPRIGFVTVTSVELSNDLRYAKIYVSIYGDEKQKKDSLEGLRKATGFVRKEIGKRIKLRYTPEIEFKFDSSIEHGAKIAKLLSEVKEDSST
jgi:ribosome-binding factor A